MGVFSRNRSNVLDVAMKGSQIQAQGDKTRQTRTMFDQKMGIANQQLGIQKEKLGIAKSLASAKLGKSSIIDHAIKVHNKKLEVISKANAARNKIGSPSFGEAPESLPKFSDTLRDDFGVDVSGNPIQQSAALPAALPATNNVGIRDTLTGNPIEDDTEQIYTQPTAQPSGIKMSSMLNPASMRQAVGTGAETALNTTGSAATGGVFGRAGMGGGQNVKAVLDKILGSIPQPKKIVNSRLPQLKDMVNALNDYDNAEDAINELMQLDDQFMAMGLDITEVEDGDQFQNAFRQKFGDAALQQLIENIGAKRGAGQ